MKKEIMQGIILEHQNHRADIDSSLFIAPSACVIGDVVIKANLTPVFGLITIFEWKHQRMVTKEPNS